MAGFIASTRPTRARLGRAEAIAHIMARSFPEDALDLTGLELEWLVVPGAGGHPLDLDRTAPEDFPLPGASAVSIEPGGQIELSSLPRPDLASLCRDVALDTSALGDRVARSGAQLLGMGLSPGEAGPRRLRTPRYDAMAEFFAADGPAGSMMMTSTASLQVNVGLGSPAARQDRWRRANVLGPVLAAAFANSPLAAGGPTGLASTRLAVWSAIDTSRTAAAWRPGRLIESWAPYVLDARVMLIRGDDHNFAALGHVALPFGRWLTDGHELGYPTLDDLDYHLTTLFPPVRPKGWLELRFLDALPAPWWPAAAAVTAALVGHEEAGCRAELAASCFHASWRLAFTHGLRHPGLQRAAEECFAAASAVMTDIGAGTVVTDALDGYVDRFVARGRTPADERLDAFERTGSPLLAEDAHQLVGAAQ